MRLTEKQILSPQFDQPVFAGSPKKVFICSSRRSGSWMLCRYMINAGLGLPAEYIHRDWISALAARFGVDGVEDIGWKSKGRARRWLVRKLGRDPRAEFMLRYIDMLIRRRTRDGIFASKIHYEQYQAILDNEAGRNLLDGGFFVQLYRQNLLGQAVSVHLARQSGKWGFNDDLTSAPLPSQEELFDATAIDNELAGLASEDSGWRLFFARNGIEPLRVSYEELARNPNAVVVEIARQIGVDPATLNLGYSEGQGHAESVPGLPSKRELRQRFIEASRRVRPFHLNPGSTSAA